MNSATEKATEAAMTTRVFYTGDIANSSGWFTASACPGGNVKLTEGGGNREFTIRPTLIGSVYLGHCNPRFVTEDAYREFYRARGIEAPRHAASRNHCEAGHPLDSDGRCVPCETYALMAVRS